MKITKLNITSFGVLTDRVIALSDGINLIGGANEAGKTSLAMFIKFMLYGLNAKNTDQFPMGEKKRFINWTTGRAEGTMEFVSGEKPYRIERSLFFTGRGEATHEERHVIDMTTGEEIKPGCEPGEYFLGVPESVFVNTVFVRQLGSTGVDSSAVSTAISNMLGSADEKIGTDRAVKKLDSVRRELIQKNSVGGKIREIEREIASEETALSDAVKRSADVIAAQSGLAGCQANIEAAEKQIEHAKVVTMLWRDIRAIEEREEMHGLVREYNTAKAAADRAKEALPTKDSRESVARAKASLEVAREQIQSRKDALASVPEAKKVNATASECDEAVVRANTHEAAARSKKTPSVILGVTGALAAVAGVILFVLALAVRIVPIILIAAGAILIIASICVAASAGKDKKVLRDMCAEWDADSVASLADRIRRVRSDAVEAENIALSRKSAEDELSLARKHLHDREIEATKVCESFGIDCADDPDSGLRECSDMMNEADARYAEARDKMSDLSAQCRAKDAKLSEYDFDAIKTRRDEYEGTPEWDEAKSLDRAGYDHAEFSIGFNEKKILANKDKIGNHRETLGANQGRTPAQIEESLSAMRTDLAEKKLRADAVQLAIDTITEAGENVRRQIVPRMTAKASRIFSDTTDGKYETIGIGSTFDMTYASQEGTRSADYLSAGSSDAAYISLRLALASVLFKKDVPPMIFDESFAKIDENRTDRLMEILAADENQSIVFTCRESDKIRTADRFAEKASVTDL